MNSEWQKVKLKDVVEINPKESIKKGTFLKKIAMDKLKPFCRDITDYEVTEFNGGSKFRNEDTIMASITPCLENGKIAKVNILDENEVGFGSTEYIIFRAIDGITNADFIYYLIYSDIVREPAIKSMVGTSGRQRVQKDVVANLKINLPSYDEQSKIAAILKSLDDKIELNNQINKNLEQQAQAIFKSWLKNSKSTIKIGDMAQNILDYTPSKHKKVILINSSDVTNGNFNHHSLSENSNLKGHFKKRFKKYDILYSEIRPKNHHYAYCQFDPENYIASTRLMIIRNKSEYISSSLLYQCIMLNKVFNEFTLKTETRSGTFPQGRYEDIAAIQVPYKIIEEQKDITAILDNFYEIIWLNQKENFNLTNIRDTLLPKLMNGEIDVSEINL